MDFLSHLLALVEGWLVSLAKPQAPTPPPPMPPETPQEAQNAPVAAVQSVTVPESVQPDPDALLPWDMAGSLSHANWHNVRALADQEGLPYGLKEELCATVWGESEFNVHAKCYNRKTMPDGTSVVTSVDHGIAQWNSFWHGKEITPDEAENDPEKAIRLMCKYFLAGQANQWVAHSSGRYKQFLGRTL